MVHRAPPVPPVLRSGTLGNSPSDNLQNTPHFGNSSRKTATSRTAVHVACRLLSKGGKRDRGLAPCSRPRSLLPAKAALLRHDMSPSWRQRIARRRSRQSSSIPAWSPSSAASRTSPQLQAAGQRVAYQDEAIECAVRHKFSAHHKAWQPWRRCHSHVTSLEPDLVSHHTVPYLLLYHICGMCMCMCMCMLHVHTYVLYICVTVYVSCVCVCRGVSFSSIFSVFHTV